MKDVTPKTLTTWLKQKGLSQRQFAKILNVDPATISNWIRRGSVSYKAQIQIGRMMEKNGKLTVPSNKK